MVINSLYQTPYANPNASAGINSQSRGISGRSGGIFNQPSGAQRPEHAQASATHTVIHPQFDHLQQKSQHGYEAQKSVKAKEVRNLLRSLKKTQDKPANPYVVTPDKMNDFLKLSGSPEDDEYEVENASTYNYKEVASKIQRAKTSTSAGEAVLSARRKVLEVKRRIASGRGDPEQLQLALTHAKRMEMTARKKKHHLELEEMVTTTGKRDERLEKQEDASKGMQGVLIEAAQEEISKQEDAIFEVRQDMISEVMDHLEESGILASDEQMAALNQMISEFGEEELEMLEETMEILESMEVVDPHMNKEDLEELKRKHRASEQKAIVKANMDYIKGMMKLTLEKGKSSLVFNPNHGFSSSTGASVNFHVSDTLPSSGSFVSSPAECETSSFNIQI